MPAFLVRDAATEFVRELGIPFGHTALANLASDGTGPRYVIINGRALYKPEDLIAWIDAQASESGMASATPVGATPPARITRGRAPAERRKAGASRRMRA